MYQNNYRVKTVTSNSLFNPPGATNLQPEILINSTIPVGGLNAPIGIVSINQNIIPLIATVSVFNVGTSSHLFSLGTPFWQSTITGKGPVFQDTVIQSQFAQSTLISVNTLISTGGEKRYFLDLNQLDFDSSFFVTGNNILLDFSTDLFATLDGIPFTFAVAAGSYKCTFTLTYLTQN